MFIHIIWVTMRDLQGRCLAAGTKARAMAAATRRFIVSLPFRKPSAREEEFG
jgi:hypothetical protein